MTQLLPVPTPLSRADAMLRRGFKVLNRFMLLNWRLGLGPMLNFAPGLLGRYMVLTHTGRKSGRTYRTPVNYAEVKDVIYCTAGFGTATDWYRNLLVDPACEIWLPNGWYAATAEDISDAPDALPLLREVLIASAFAARVAGLDPVRMSDTALHDATRDYRLVRLTPTATLTGPGGPGDLPWVRPVALVGLISLLAVPALRRLRKQYSDIPPDLRDVL